MPTFAEKLFDFTQRRQAMALDQDRFAEARRQFDLSNQLGHIQTQQNSRRLDLLAEAQKASERGQREAHEIQRQGIEINKKATEATIENYKFNQKLAEFGIIQSGQGLRGESGELVPVDQSVLESKAFERQRTQQIDALKGLDTFLKEQYPKLSQKERASIATKAPQVLQQSTGASNAGINAALLNARFGQETMGVIGRARAAATEAGKNFDDLSTPEVSEFVDKVLADSGPQITSMFGSITSDPVASIRASAINSIEATRVNQALRRAQTIKAGQQDIGDLIMRRMMEDPEFLKNFTNVKP